MIDFNYGCTLASFDGLLQPRYIKWLILIYIYYIESLVKLTECDLCLLETKKTVGIIKRIEEGNRLQHFIVNVNRYS